MPGLVWDAHSCLPLLPGHGMAELARHRAAGINHVSINVGMDFNPVEQVMRVIAGFRAWLAQHADEYLLADSVAAVRRAQAEGKLSVAFDLEGSDMLLGDLAMLRLYRDLGVRQIHLAYNRDNAVGGGCHGADVPLTPFGHQVVAEINALGLLMDCSHTGYRTSMDVMAASRRPVIFSHSSVRALKDHPRNIRDDQIDACAATGGVIGLSGIGIFIGDNDIRTGSLLRHIDHVCERVGPAHAGLGLDFVFDQAAKDSPPGLDPAAWWPPEHGYGQGTLAIVPPEQMPEIAEALLQHGYSESEARGILGENFLRVAEATWPAGPATPA